jgi:hypothetical protein
MLQNITSLTAGGHIHPLSAPASPGPTAPVPSP